MPVNPRLRRLLPAALPALLAVAFAACSTAAYPNSVFTNATEYNREIGFLFKILIWAGTAVFVLVELLLLYTIWRFRRRSDDDRPEHVHGNTTLEILWTAIPALILALIAVPTVRTIFLTQAKATADALQVQVVGHQWWWEFRYPQYTFTGPNGKLDTLTTANELYLPVGRKVNFALQSKDVIHSFSIPRLGGKRDLITNHTNYLWFTPDSIGEQALNGMCAEYCGDSHANMRFKVFTVTPEHFSSWVAHQLTPAAFGATPAVGAPSAAAATVPVALASATQAVNRQPAGLPTAPAAATTTPGHDMSAMSAAAPPAQAGTFIAFPREEIPAFAVPATPIPDVQFNDALKGDAERGRQLMTQGQGACLGCHTIVGNPVMMGIIGPNLTHVGSRSTIAGGLYPNDSRHLARWIKNALWMKPGVLMPTIGVGQYDPILKTNLKQGLTDEQIADMVAYLQALK
jgi:cytochrome c oxidase subunit 2